MFGLILLTLIGCASAIVSYWMSIALILWCFGVAPVASWSLFNIVATMIASGVLAGICKAVIGSYNPPRH